MSRLLFSTTVVLSTAVLAASGAGAADDVRYNRDVRPILADTCFRCHGPGVQKAGLRLDSAEAASRPTKSGAVPVVAGKPDESEIVRRILADDPGEVMPPPAARKPLTPAQKETLKRWVAAGARYEKLWSFEPPVKAEPPRPDGFSIRNPIDAFIADRLRRDGLTMAPEADRETLIRRVAFTLTGLPPTPQEVDLYLGDSSSKAYENMVERYLFSPRFGEEMARHWLDVARYADTHGLHLDNERQMWPYRDWVVRAFNDDLPFDRFTTEQLAGDLLPNATPDQLVATGFNRCNVSTSEGGSIETEWIFRNAVDRASTAAETWLGLTAGCAVCHDHKYDPLSAVEFYSFYAFFYSAGGPALDGNALRTEPFLKLPTNDQRDKLAALDKELADARAELARKYQELAYADPAEAPAPSAAPVVDAAKSFRSWLKQGDGPLAKQVPADLKPALNQAKDGKAPADAEKRLREFYLQNVCETTKGTFQPLLDSVATKSKEREALDNAIPGSFIFRELGTPREAFVMLRGQYDKPGPKVEPSTPAVLPPLQKAKADGRATRLDLARWLTSAEQPLTPRVTVNRFWQQVFGTGLVKTSFDFGSQGEPPSHPELLDWLAVTFRERGWGVKDLMRMLLTSATFRQSTRVTPEVLKRDPDNRLYARGPRMRLDAEQLRDNALYTSGLMNFQMGGAGVRPYQPPNIWEPVAFSGSNTGVYRPDTGPALYRRSLYAFLKRTAPPPFMSNFDAPNREAFCTRRERSNTPLQALQLMNDVQHFEAARALAERMMVEGGTSPKDRITFGARVVLSRVLEADELTVLEAQWNKHLARYQRDPEAAKHAVRVGQSAPRAGLPETELAAYALVANTLLNLDETINRN